MNKLIEELSMAQANTSKIISKFGGTSMGDASCMMRSAEVALQQKSSLVVVSATSGTTNDLILLGQVAEKGKKEDVQVILEKIKTRHLKIASDLQFKEDELVPLYAHLQELEDMARGILLLKDCSLKARDALMSFGELLSSRLFVKAMGHVLQKSGQNSRHVFWFHAGEILITDNDFSKAKPQIKEMKEKALTLKGAINRTDAGLGDVYVTQGFIGKSQDGFTTTLGRGGSDYSAALFAEALEADILEIWTDVAGIATTDPRITSKAKGISEISFKEASEMAVFGAKVLHPATLLPAMREDIPVFVGSSFDANLGGTWVKRTVDFYPPVRALALRKNQVLLTLTTPEMLYTHGFLFMVFKIFNDHKVSVDSITTSEVSVAMTLDDSTLLNKALMDDLSRLGDLHVEEGLSLVSLIGNDLHKTSGLAKKIFETIPDVNVRLICHGASKHNFCFLVDQTKDKDVVQRLHQKFIEEV